VLKFWWKKKHVVRMIGLDFGKIYIDNMLGADIYVCFLKVLHAFLRRIYSSLSDPAAQLVG
jgi:hypothetical protein